MKVLCKKIFSSVTGEDLGLMTHSLKVGNEYTILSMSYSKNNGIYISLITENFNEPALFHLTGFEFISHYVPSSWVTTVEEFNEEKYIDMLPASWNYESFFDDLEDEEEHAMQLFHQEAQKIYEEEEQYAASQKK